MLKPLQNPLLITLGVSTGERAENVPGAFRDLHSKEVDCIFSKFLEFYIVSTYQVDTNTLNFELVCRAGRYTIYSIDYLTELF